MMDKSIELTYKEIEPFINLYHSKGKDPAFPTLELIRSKINFPIFRFLKCDIDNDGNTKWWYTTEEDEGLPNKEMFVFNVLIPILSK